MEPSTPLTRCNSCQTVFEVPQEILDSVDSRVRCGECLQVFDAKSNLHKVDKPDLGALLPATDSTLDLSAQLSEAQVAAVDSTLASNDALTNDYSNVAALAASSAHPVRESSSATTAYSRQEQTRQARPDPAAVSAGNTRDAHVGSGRLTKKRAVASASPSRAGTDSAAGIGHPAELVDNDQLEHTLSDFDLFSKDADLPFASFEDSTIDAIELDFDMVEDIQEETLSNTLFEADVTINAQVDANNLRSDEVTRASTAAAANEAKGQSGQIGDTGQIDDTGDTGMAGRANTGFDLDDVDSVEPPDAVEFDYREPAPLQQSDSSLADSPNEHKAAAAVDSDYAQQQLANASVVDQASTEGLLPPALAEDSPDTLDSISDLEIADHGIADDTNYNGDATLAEGVAYPDAKTLPWSGAGIRKGLPYLAVCGLLLVLVAALYIWRHRANLADNGLTRPVYQAWCLVAQCEVPARSDKSQLLVLSKNIFSHPQIENALVITIVIKNTASFEQRYPVLFLWLSDRERRTVASNDFDPAVYLPENNLPTDSILMPGQQQRISIDVLDPGDEAVSLELNFK